MISKNEKQMDYLISGITKEAFQNPQKNVNENIGNTDNSSNTDYKRMVGNIEHNNNPGNAGNAINTESDKGKEIRFCTIVDAKTLRKIRIVANREGLLIKDVVGAAFNKAIACYEAKHGVIEGDVRGRTDNLF